jgi:hypothetical protein
MQEVPRLPAPAERALEDLVQLRTEFARFMLENQFGIDEMKTKIGILRLGSSNATSTTRSSPSARC